MWDMFAWDHPILAKIPAVVLLVATVLVIKWGLKNYPVDTVGWILVITLATAVLILVFGFISWVSDLFF